MINECVEIKKYNIGDKVYYIGTFSIKEAEVVQFQEYTDISYYWNSILYPNYIIPLRRRYIIKFKTGRMKLVDENKLF